MPQIRLSTIYSDIRNNILISNIFILVRGNFLAYLVSVLAYFILPRFYTPEEFGNLGAFVGASTILFTFSTGRLERAILLPKKLKDAFGLVKISLFLSVSLCLVALISIHFLKGHVLRIIPIKNADHLIYYIPLLAFLLAIIEILTFYINRLELYKVIANVKIVNSITNFLASISIGLITGEIIGRVLSLLFLIKKSYKLLPLKKSIDNPKKLIAKYKDFLIKSTPAAFLGVLSNNLFLIVLGNIYSNNLLGQYLIAYKILSIPVALMGKAISQVFYKKSIELSSANKLFDFVKKTSFILFAIISSLMLVIFLLAEKAILIMYGTSWINTAIIIKLLIPYFILNFVFTCQSTLLYVKNKQGYELLINTFSIVSQIIILLFAYYKSLDFELTFILITISLSIINLTSILYIFKISK